MRAECAWGRVCVKPSVREAGCAWGECVGRVGQGCVGSEGAWRRVYVGPRVCGVRGYVDRV